MSMYILSDGKNYVIDNPMKPGQVMMSTAASKAKMFSYKQARSLLQNRSKRLSWIKNFEMISADSGEKPEVNLNYRGNKDTYVGDNDIEFKEEILDEIIEEAESILGLTAWNKSDLESYINTLSAYLSKFDSAKSDVDHALEKYYADNGGKNPQAHKMAKIGYIMGDLRVKHRNIKQCIRYINVMQDAITYKYTLEKLKLELNKVENAEYAGRTEYYKKALDILE